MKVRINLTEEVTEIYEVEYDGLMENFDPIEYMTDEYMVSSKVGNSDYYVETQHIIWKEA